MAFLLKMYEENPNERHLNQIVEILRNGGLIIYPTDTVYSIGCDLHNPKAIERVARIKNIKPEKADFSIIFDDLSRLSQYTKSVNNSTFKILKRILPGPYTCILSASSVIPKLFKNNKKTIGIRIPDNAIPRSIVTKFDSPIIATSVHDDDEVIEYTTDPELIFEKYGHLVDVVIDGGYGDNYASTVIDFSLDTPEVLREGKGPVDEIV
jgi:tRNA threonylcarbamoyl adenosine modification protein (Sua5/YciO/YrdC/YwlC family)